MSSEAQIIFDSVDVSNHDNVWVHAWIRVNEPTKFKRYEFYAGYVKVDSGGWNQFFRERTTRLGAYQEKKYYVGNNASKVSIKIVFNLDGICTGSNSKIYYLDDVSITGNLSENNQLENIARTSFETARDPIGYTLKGTPDDPDNDYWGKVEDSGVTHYKVHIDGVNVENVSDNYLRLENEFSEGPHLWSVRAVDQAGNEAQSPTWEFTVDVTPPTQPSKVSPQDNMVTPENVIKFKWTRSTDNISNVENYEIWIDDNPDFSSPENKEIVTAIRCTPPELPEARYYWRVRAWDESGNPSDFENAWTFLIDNSPPGKPTLTHPDNTVENSAVPTFNWRAANDPSGIDHYEFQLDREDSFNPPIFFEEDYIGDNYFILDQALITDNFGYWYMGKFYWRVRATDKLGYKGKWSQNVPFTLALRDFKFSINPTSSEIRRTHYGLVEITAERLGSHEEIIDLSCSEQPQGVRVFFDVLGAVPSFKYQMTIAVEEDAPLGTYTLTVAGRDSYNNEHSDNYQLTVLRKPTAVIPRINAGEENTFTIGKQKILQVTISAANKIENGVLTVKEYSEKPTEIPPIEKPTYAYINFEMEEIENQDISNARIEFRVHKIWMDQNNIDPETIKLNKYAAGEWQPLPTERIDDTATHLHYSAETTGFSIFAITGEEKPPGTPMIWYLIPVIAVIVIAMIIWRRRGPEEEWREEPREEGEEERPTEIPEEPPEEEEEWGVEEW